MITSGVVLLSMTLAYTETIAQWGSPALIEAVDRLLSDLRGALGAVPQPIEVFLGFPALAWGVSTRARRRQGWWASAFGAPGLAVVAVSLLPDGATLVEAGLSLVYGLVLGLALGYVVIRADLYLTGARDAVPDGSRPTPTSSGRSRPVWRRSLSPSPGWTSTKAPSSTRP